MADIITVTSGTANTASGGQTAGGWISSGNGKKVLIVDRAVELDPTDKKALEDLGYLVVEITGSPASSVLRFGF